MPIFIVLIVLIIIKLLFDNKNIDDFSDITDRIRKSLTQTDKQKHLQQKSNIDFLGIDTNKAVASAIKYSSANNFHEIMKLTEKEIEIEINSQLNSYSSLKNYGPEISMLSRKIAASIKNSTPA